MKEGNFDFNTRTTVDDFKEYFRGNCRNAFFSLFEMGIDDVRFDLIRINPYRQYIRIFEFKSGRSDFLADKKWQKYLKYCHTLTFVCPREEIQKDDLPAGIGLLWIYKWRHKRFSKVMTPKWTLGSEWIKRPKVREVSKDVMLQMAFTLVHRVKWRKDEVF